MVSFKPTGRLGNFLFTAATAIAYCHKHGFEFTVPTHTNDKFWNPVYLPHLAKFWDIFKPVVVIREKEYFRYDPLEFSQHWKENSINIRLEGYFQNPKYFENYRDQVLKAFAFPWNPLKNVISVHVRRGDYLTLRHKHPEVTTEWILKAMKIFEGGDVRFAFYSDDIDWCEKTFGERQDCLFMRNGNEISDLVGISNCEHHINSSSTFSWWGAWLNQNPDKIVIMPKRWFTPEVSNEWTEEIIPKEWRRM